MQGSALRYSQDAQHMYIFFNLKTLSGLLSRNVKLYNYKKSGKKTINNFTGSRQKKVWDVITYSDQI